MNKKISDRDKEDWENFLQNKKKSLNHNTSKKKYLTDTNIIEISSKDKQDWENFVKNKEKIPNKDFVKKKKYKT